MSLLQSQLVKLLNFQVDDNGKINRLRRECPAEECGAGVFMAAHFDRQYCGKCGLTYVFNWCGNDMSLINDLFPSWSMPTRTRSQRRT